eukprot:scaffold1312_cov393-Prasinococcus_capsulatus_cf.AAC.8
MTFANHLSRPKHHAPGKAFHNLEVLLYLGLGNGLKAAGHTGQVRHVTAIDERHWPSLARTSTGGCLAARPLLCQRPKARATRHWVEVAEPALPLSMSMPPDLVCARELGPPPTTVAL